MLVTEKQEILAHDRRMRSGGRIKVLENNESCPRRSHTSLVFTDIPEG